MPDGALLSLTRMLSWVVERFVTDQELDRLYDTME